MVKVQAKCPECANSMLNNLEAAGIVTGTKGVSLCIVCSIDRPEECLYLLRGQRAFQELAWTKVSLIFLII